MCTGGKLAMGKAMKKQAMKVTDMTAGNPILPPA